MAPLEWIINLRKSRGQLSSPSREKERKIERERESVGQSGGRDEETRSVNCDVNDRGHGWLRQTTV